MSEDKYAPKANDGLNEIHAKHLWLIKDQQAANKKEREESDKPKVVPGKVGREAKDSLPTQPPASEQPANPSADQLKPNVPQQNKEAVDVNERPQPLPDSNQK